MTALNALSVIQIDPPATWPDGPETTLVQVIVPVIDTTVQAAIDAVQAIIAALAIGDIEGLIAALDSKLGLGGGTLTGALTLPGAPTEDLHAATKAYADDLIEVLKGAVGADRDTLKELSDALDAVDAAKMPKAGGIFTGPVELHGDPEEDLEAAPKQYVDAAIASGAAAYKSTALTTSVSMPALLKLMDTISFSEWSPAGDGITDVTAKFQNAVSEVPVLRKKLHVPAPEVAWRLTSRINLQKPMAWKGDNWRVDAGTLRGTIFLIDHLDEAFRYRSADGIDKHAGLWIEDVAFRWNQPTPGPGWAPLDANFFLRAEGVVHLENVMTLNPTRGVWVRDAGVFSSNRWHGQPLLVGCYIERSAHTGKHVNPEFWPFWSEEANVTAFTIANRIGWDVERADGLVLISPFDIFGKRLMRIAPQAGRGSGANGVTLVYPYADIGGAMLEVISENYESYVTIHGGIMNADSAGRGEGHGVHVRGSLPSRVGIYGYTSKRTYGSAVRAEGSAHRITLAAEQLRGHNQDGSGAYTIEARDGAIIHEIAAAEYSTTPYLEANGGKIIRAPRAGLTEAAENPGGEFAWRRTIADDAAGWIVAPSVEGVCTIEIIPVAPPSATYPSGVVWCRANGTPTSKVLRDDSGVALLLASAGIKTGTTSTDGKFTISPHSDGRIYFENRTGASVTFIVSVAGR